MFIKDGWIPNAGLASIQPYMLTYLLPILIASTGGALVSGDGGRVMGAIAVVGCIAGVGGTEGQTMLMGAMVIGPFMTAVLAVLTAGVNVLITNSLLPLVAVFVEPAKVLFLNNAINHGIFTPIGSSQASEFGKSIMYMLEANPGPGLGVLLAYCFFSKDKTAKQSAPGAVIIHFLGGIHEIYFPYVLMNPLVIIAPIVGNMCSIAFFMITDCGLKAPSSPGSIIAFLSMTPKDKMFFTVIGILIASVVSFLIASPIIRFTDGKKGSLSDAQGQMQQMKAQAKGQAATANDDPIDSDSVKKIIFACDAGMGSSAMGATKFRNRIKDARPEIIVKNTSVDNIPSDCDVAVVQATLADRAKKSAPQAKLIAIGNFLADPALDALYRQLTTQAAQAKEPPKAAAQTSAPQTEAAGNAQKKEIINKHGIKLNQKPVSKEDAIRAAGELLVKQGCVDEAYVDAMLEREKLVSTYMGMGLAIPHGTSEVKDTVKKTGIVLVQYPDGVDFGDEKAQLVFGIAGIGDEHLDLLAKICEAVEDEAVLEKMKTTDDIDWILEKLK